MIDGNSNVLLAAEAPGPLAGARWSSLLLGAAALLFLCAVAVAHYPSADLWWHLRAGQYILETHHVPRTDPFSFSAAGKPWIAHEWLSEVILYSVYHYGGFRSLSAAMALVAGGAFWLVTWTAKPRPRLGVIAAAFAVWSVRGLLLLRPGDFTLLLGAAFLWRLRRFQETGRVRPLAALPLLTLLWVNLHGGYVLGLVLILLFALGTLLERWGGQRVQGVQQARALGLALLSCALVVPLNPNGLRMYGYPLKTLFSPVMQSAIVEWQPLNLAWSQFRLFEAFVLAAFLVMIVQRKRTKPTELVLFIPVVLLALRSMRNLTLCALVCAYIFGCHPVLGGWRWPRRVKIRPAARYVLAMAGVLLALAALCVQVGRTARRLQSWEQTHCPSGAVAFLQEHGLHGRIFNSYAFGGYLIWRLYPESQVYVDGRADMYGDAFLTRYLNLYLGLVPLEPELDQQKVDILVLHRFSYLGIQSPEVKMYWTSVYEDSVSAIFVRRKSREAGLLHKSGG